MRDVERAPDYCALHQYGWIDGKAPISALSERPCWIDVELCHLPVLEHARFTVALIAAEPYVRELLRVAPLVVLNLDGQHVRQSRVVQIVRLHHDSSRRRRFTTQQHVNRVCRKAWVP